MCGLVAVFGRIDQSDKDRFLELIDVGKIRGEHATGLSAISASLKPEGTAGISTFKKAMHGSDFIEYHSREINAALLGDKQGILGHNRWRTMGDNTDDNAHPYTFGHITGVHNGVISASALAGLPSPSDHPVDSQRLYYSMANSGVDATIESVHGDWALIWHDRKVNKFYFLRNSGREFYYRYADDKQVLWVMSESEMGDWILGRSYVNLDDEGWKKFEVDQLYSLDATRERLSLVKERTVTGKKLKTITPSVVAPVRQYGSYEEWAARNNPKPPTLWKPSSSGMIPAIGGTETPPTPSNVTMLGLGRGEAYIGKVPLFTFTELKEMDKSALETLQQNIQKNIADLTVENSLNYIELAKHNWSEKVTWRIQHRQKVVRDVLYIEKTNDTIQRLKHYGNIVKGRVLVKTLSTPTLVPKSHAIEMFTDISVRIKNKETHSTVDRHNLFSTGARTEEEWINALAKAVEDNKSFVGPDNYMAYDNDLRGQINICWTAGKDVNDQEHREVCKRIHKMLDYHVSTRLKNWDRNFKRYEYFNNFNKAVTIRSYGMDWQTPSSKYFDLVRPLFAKSLYRFVKQAVEWGLGNYYIHPAILAETLYKLEQPHPMQEQEAAA